ncbi:MAG: phosphoglycerate kinase [Acidobacteria bacterium]|nr:phosphoglycerate kinase [Acidobacteriota bacterium]
MIPPPNLQTALAGGRLDVRRRRVVVRVDFNVPMAGSNVLDATRLREAAPTIRALSGAGARVVLLSHRGRPGGTVDPGLTLRPVAQALAGILDRPVAFAEDCVGPAAQEAAAALGDGEACLCENLRFHAGEERNDPALGAELAALGEVYVNDAFGTAHRAHASTAAVCAHVKQAFSGLLLDRELRQLGRLLDEPPRPFVLIVGGAKIRGKIDAVLHLLPLVDRVLVGGGMANTFLAARGYELGSSLVEREGLDLAQEIEGQTAARGSELLLPADLVVTDSLDAPGNRRQHRIVPADGGVPAGWLAVDIGPATRDAFARAAADAATLFWNGPMGVFETPPFDAGSRAVARAVAACPGFTAVGGGETVAAVKQEGLSDRIDHVSTGGGASLALLAGEELPAVAALRRAGSGRQQ